MKKQNLTQVYDTKRELVKKWMADQTRTAFRRGYATAVKQVRVLKAFQEGLTGGAGTGAETEA